MALTVVLSLVAAERSATTSDFRDFWENAREWRRSGHISGELGVHNYLPAFTILMTPWSLLPLPAAAGAFVALSMSAYAGAILLSQQMLRGDLRGGPHAGTLLASALMLPYIVSCASLGQLGLLLAALTTIGLHQALRRRGVFAGALLGLAVVIKLIPGVLLAWLALRRRFAAVAATLAACALLGLALPLAALGWAEASRQHAEFAHRAAVGHSAVRTILDEQPIKANYSNNSLPIVLRRLLSPVDARKGDADALLVTNALSLPRRAILAAYWTIAAIIAGVSIACTPWRALSDEAGPPRRRRVEQATYGLWMCVSLLASPLLWTHYLAMLMQPMLCVSTAACDPGCGGPFARRAARIALVVWACGALLLAWPTARACGAQLISVLALWVALAIVSVAARSAPRDGGNPGA